MDGDTASKFVASLVKSIQALCNGYIDFSSSIEVIGHIHLRIDENKKFNYVLSEEVSKSQNEAATVFSSHSYHSQPPQTTTTGRTAPSDSPSRNRRKTQQVPRVDESTLPPDVPSASKDSRYSDRLDSPASRRLSDGGDSRDTDTFPSVRKHEHNSGAGKQSTPSQDSFDRRRKLQPDSDTHSSRSQDPVPKKSRTGLSLSGSAAVQSSGFEVIEIKEEPADDESGDFFGDNNAAGQDISQPDFSNLVADSLDRVGQLEGTSLLAGGDAQQIPRQQLRGQQDQPFPIMLHANPTASTSSTVSYPGPSDQQGAVASSSGGDEDVDVKSVGKLKTEIVVPGTVFVGAYREYTADDVAEAIELVHGGMPVIDAAFRFGIPRATLFVRSRQGCPTHTGRCSTVFARTHQEAAASARRNRPKLQYTKEAVEAAIDAVHNGVPVIDAAIQFNIPRATLFNRSGKGCPTHEGRCSTVFSDGQLRRTSKKRFQITFE